MNEYKFEVLIPEGLHARPCAKIVALLKPFEPLKITHKETTLETLSILDLLLLKIGYGGEVCIILDKPLPAEMLSTISAVFADIS